MAIKKKTLTSPDPDPEPEPNKLPDFDNTQAEGSDLESLMDQAVREAKDTGFEKLPVGNWVGIVDYVDTWESEKGVFYRIHLICNVNGNPQFRHTIWCHMLLDDRRTFHEWGPTFYKRHMASLGYTAADDGKKVREQLKNRKPGIIVSSQPNRKNPEFNDVSIRDRIGDDNEEVQLIKENLENSPY